MNVTNLGVVIAVLNFSLSLMAIVRVNAMQGYLKKIVPQGNDNFENTCADKCKLFVGNIDYSASQKDVSEHFARFGSISSVSIPVNRAGKIKGFGFIKFENSRDAAQALSLNGSELKGRRIQVNFAKQGDPA